MCFINSSNCNDWYILVFSNFPAIATIGTFWYLVISTIINGTFPKKPTDKEIEEKTK